jgi:ketosteroid isomerase-like protein
MSDPGQQNVETILAAFEWGNRERKLPRQWWHDDGEYVNSREDPDHATHRGVKAIEKLFASWIEAYPDIQVHPLEARGNGDIVFVWARFVGTSAATGIPLTMELALVITLEDGLIRSEVEYFDRAEGLAAAGLSE